MVYAVTERDYDTLVSESRKRGIDPEQAALILFEESAGFDPHRVGRNGLPFSGLNMMSDTNLSDLDLTREQWIAMSAAEQLPIIFRFWDGLARAFAGGSFPQDAAHLIALNFLPSRYRSSGAKSNDDAVLTKKPENFYLDNTWYDPGATGTITVNTIRKRLSTQTNNGRWRELVAGIDEAEKRAGSVEPAVPPPAVEPEKPEPVAPTPEAPGDGPVIATTSQAGMGQKVFLGVAIAGIAAWVLHNCQK